MKLDRSFNEDGKGKYALVRLRGIEKDSEAFSLLKRLEDLGHLNWGSVGEEDEFFVIKLRDIFVFYALDAYADAVSNYSRLPSCKDEAGQLEYAKEIRSLLARAGINSEFCKVPN